MFHHRLSPCQAPPVSESQEPPQESWQARPIAARMRPMAKSLGAQTAAIQDAVRQLFVFPFVP